MEDIERATMLGFISEQGVIDKNTVANTNVERLIGLLKSNKDEIKIAINNMAMEVVDTLNKNTMQLAGSYAVDQVGDHQVTTSLEAELIERQVIDDGRVGTPVTATRVGSSLFHIRLSFIQVTSPSEFKRRLPQTLF